MPRLRRKSDTTIADPSWSAGVIDPRTVTATVAAAADGAYSITVNPIRDGVASVPNTHTRSGAETTSDIAAALDVLVTADAAANGTLDDYIESSSDSTNVVSLVIEEDAPPFDIETAAASGAITLSPDDVYPHFAKMPAGKSKVAISMRMLDSSGTRLSGATTADVTVLPFSVESVPGSATKQVVPDRAQALTGHTVLDGFTVDIGEGRYFTVQLSALTGPPGSIDAIEVWWTTL